MRIGIFGGTFDPPHMGHLILAMEAHFQLGLDRLLWVLTQSPPHKQDQAITPVERRILLLESAIRDNSCFEISRLEIDRPGPHYAADTVRLLAQQLPGVELCYLIGGDSLHDFPQWYHPQVIIDNCFCLGVMRRPGDAIDFGRLENQIPGITKKLRFIHTPMLEISSTTIRCHILEGKPYRYYLPEPVYNLIEHHGFYRT
jgi:nicotinate-nucleotide adenylyltransferase